MGYDFANILFSGRCNARCSFCIGKQVDPRLNQPNLDIFPPRNLAQLLTMIVEHDVRQVVFTGTNTDPQLYRHEARLLDTLRRRLPPETRISLHTNGRLALRRMQIFNSYDRVSISFPSFVPQIYQAVMGVPHPPDLAEIIRQAQVPIKVSCVLTENNLPDLLGFLTRCGELGVQRVVLRKLYGDQRPWRALFDPAALGLKPNGCYCGNPVLDYYGIQVTLWDFERSKNRSINLFSSGHISAEYLLTAVSAPEASIQINSVPAFI